MAGIIPVIDVTGLRTGDAAARRAVAHEIAAACTDNGFFTLIGHGVAPDLIARTRLAAADFFAAPAAVKTAVLRPPEKISRGWNPPMDRTLASTLGDTTPPDLQEAWAMGPIETGAGAYYTDGAGASFFAANKWPEIPGYRETLEEYYRAMVGLAGDMMRGFALALDLDEHFFDDKTDRNCANMRLVRYPAQTTAPIPGQLRAGAHTDYGNFTFVKGDNVPGGLQVSDGAGGWIDVEAPDGGYVCNIADALHRWTGGRFRSTLHRVVNPPPDAAPQDRISLVFFHHPNHDVRLDGIGDTAADTATDNDQGDAITYAEHYFGKIVRAATTDGAGSTVTADALVSGKTV